jgi:hypothetical protein
MARFRDGRCQSGKRGEARVAEVWRLDETTVRLLATAVDHGDADVIELIQRAVARVATRETGTARVGNSGDERRLGDRILWALDLALDQENLDVAEHLELAFEAAMTRFGGAGAVEQRELPEGMLRVYERLDDLRGRRYRL